MIGSLKAHLVPVYMVEVQETIPQVFFGEPIIAGSLASTIHVKKDNMVGDQSIRCQ